MADNLKLSLSGVYSENPDFTDPEFSTNFEDFVTTPDEALVSKVEAATGGGTTYNTSIYTSLSLVAVKNTSSTNFVTATFRSAGNGAVNNIIRISAGGYLVVTDFTVANNLLLVADTSPCNCKVLIAGT